MNKLPAERFIIADKTDIKCFLYSQYRTFSYPVKGLSSKETLRLINVRESHIKDKDNTLENIYCVIELTKAQLVDLALSPFIYREIRPFGLRRKTNRTFEYPWRYEDFKTISIKEFLDKYNDK